MPELTLTDFVNIVSKSGLQRAAEITRIKNRPPYEPAFDFYKPIRDQIILVHSENLPKSSISSFLSTITDSKKVNNYPSIIQGYLKWWGRKNISWFSPSSESFSYRDVDIKVNPELGLNINGNPYLIKLYFKSEPITKSRATIITHLMKKMLSGHCPPTTKMAVLDARKSSLIIPNTSIPHLDSILESEISYIKDFWSKIP